MRAIPLIALLFAVASCGASGGDKDGQRGAQNTPDVGISLSGYATVGIRKN